MPWLKIVPLWVWIALVGAIAVGAQQLRIASLQADMAKQSQMYAERSAEQAAKALSEQEAMASDMANADMKAIEVINNAKQEAEKLRDCVDRGTGCGLRIKTVTRNVPSACSPAGVGDTGSEWAELDPGVRRHYFYLRERLPVVQEALRLCVSQYPRTNP
jgi:hypothetical protein